MGNEPPENFSLKEGYLRVAGVCGRAEYLEKIRHDHSLDKLTLSGLPNGTGERAYIPPLTLIDYRLAFGPDDAGCLAVHNNLTEYEASGIAGEAIQGDVNLGPSQITYVRTEQRMVLAEGATEINSSAYEAISDGSLSKPGEAPVVFTELHMHAINLGAFECKPPANRGRKARAITAAIQKLGFEQLDSMLQKGRHSLIKDEVKKSAGIDVSSRHIETVWSRGRRHS